MLMTAGRLVLLLAQPEQGVIIGVAGRCMCVLLQTALAVKVMAGNIRAYVVQNTTTAAMQVTTLRHRLRCCRLRNICAILLSKLNSILLPLSESGFVYIMAPTPDKGHSRNTSRPTICS